MNYTPQGAKNNPFEGFFVPDKRCCGWRLDKTRKCELRKDNWLLRPDGQKLKWKGKRLVNSDQRKKSQTKYISIPENRERQRRRCLETNKKRYRTDPAYRKSMIERVRNRIKCDPAYWRRQQESKKKRYQRLRLDPQFIKRRAYWHRKTYWRRKAAQHWSNPNKWLKIQEMAVKSFLEERFGQIFLFNKSVTTGDEIHCTDSKTHRFPDFLFETGFFPLIAECDEHEHRGADYSCDYKRMAEIAAALGSQCLFIRYNPASKQWDELYETVKGFLDVTDPTQVEWEPSSFDQFAVTYIGYSAKGLAKAKERADNAFLGPVCDKLAHLKPTPSSKDKDAEDRETDTRGSGCTAC